MRGASGDPRASLKRCWPMTFLSARQDGVPVPQLLKGGRPTLFHSLDLNFILHHNSTRLRFSFSALNRVNIILSDGSSPLGRGGIGW